MPRHPRMVMEYRAYDLPPHFPVLVLTGEEWRISDVPSGVLHFHNCLEIGLCVEGGGVQFLGGELPGELESLLFCVQTGIGVGVIAFFLGRFVERKKIEKERENEQK